MPKKVIDLTGNRLPALQRQAAAGARLRPLPVGQARANLRNLVEIDVSGMLELLQSSVFRPREQILRELELLYIYLFQQILYCGNPTIVSGLRFFQNLHWQTDPSFSFITFYDLFGCPKQFLSMKNLDTSVAAAQARLVAPLAWLSRTHDMQSDFPNTFQLAATANDSKYIMPTTWELLPCACSVGWAQHQRAPDRQGPLAF